MESPTLSQPAPPAGPTPALDCKVCTTGECTDCKNCIHSQIGPCETCYKPRADGTVCLPACDEQCWDPIPKSPTPAPSKASKGKVAAAVSVSVLILALLGVFFVHKRRQQQRGDSYQPIHDGRDEVAA